MEREQVDLESLFLKKLNGTISADENVYLTKRLRSSAQERTDFELTKQVWEGTKQLTPLQEMLPAERWERLEQRIEADVAAKPSSREHVLLYAAAVALLVAIVGVYLLSRPQHAVEIQTAYAETKTVTLPDASTVVLNADTKISYDKSSWDKNRTIHLNGEAFFDVKKNRVPFVVFANNTIVDVLGTTFNVRARGETTDVKCLTGKVNFSIEPNRSVTLVAGKGATATQHTISPPYIISSTATMLWINGGLSFDNAPLGEVFKELERHFNVRFIIKKDLGVLTFTGKFKKPRLNTVVETICLSAGLKFTIAKDSVVIE